MRVKWNKEGKFVTLPDMSNAGMPALRLLAHHAPRQMFACVDGSNTVLVPLGELNLDHDSITSANTH